LARRSFRKLNGILLLDKALGVSSNKALQDARFLFQAEKAGHTGSLDPLASGMLPICFGEATKVSGLLLDSSKRYQTTVTLGFVSSTGDEEGEKLNGRVIPTLNPALIESVLSRFRGNIQQIPPMYSALKKDGQPLYKLARQGVEVERKPRSVTIYHLTLLGFTENSLQLDVVCSKGTYIRTLVEDIGEALGCGAYVSRLHRVSVDPFAEYTMYSLQSLREVVSQASTDLDSLLLPIDAALPQLPRLDLSEEWVARLQQGQRIKVDLADSELIRLYSPTQTFIGLGTIQHQLLLAKRLLAY
jgi:tRNA pseudouridine55 synthase